IFENLRARPRAWLVPEVLNLKATEAFTAVRTSRLPDGRAFDAARLALVEEPLTFKADQFDQTATADIARVSSSDMEVRVASKSPAFLVTSDVSYPGWRVTIDGAPAQLYQTDYALRGVPVPAGSHVVHFEFAPRPFHHGMATSAISLLLLIGFVW